MIARRYPNRWFPSGVLRDATFRGSLFLILLVTGACAGGGGGDEVPPVKPVPTVVATNPASSATNVPLDSPIAATFSEPVDPATLTATTVSLRTGFTTLNGTISYDASTATATFTPAPSSLVYDQAYTVRISTGVADAAGTNMVADFFWTFTTVPPPDTTPPTVVATSPVDLANTVRVNSVVTATLSETMDPATLNPTTFTVTPVNPAGGTLAGTVSYVGRTATFKPTALLENSTEYVARLTTAVTDVAGNALETDYTWRFTVPEKDITPPTVVATSPKNGATAVSLDASVTAIFDEEMEPTTLNTTTFTVSTGGSSILGTVSYTGVTATFKPATPLVRGVKYTVLLTTAVTDVVGNPLAANSQDGYTWTFTIASPRFAYVANLDNTVTVYVADPETGQLTHHDDQPAGDAPISVTADPFGRFVYVANQISNDVATFSIDQATGALTTVGNPVAAGGGQGPVAVTVDPLGRYAYVANRDSLVTAFGINPDGTLSRLAGAHPNPATTKGSSVTSVTVDPLGRFVYVTNRGSNSVTQFLIDADGTLSLLSGTIQNPNPAPAGSAPYAVTVDPAGEFAYVANNISSDVTTFRIDQGTGALTAVGGPVSVAPGGGPFSVSADPSGRFVYVANAGTSNVTTFRIDQGTGALTAVGVPVSVAPGSGPHSVTVDPSGRFVYVANAGTSNVTMFLIDQASGALTPTGTVVPTGSGPQSIVVLGIFQ